MERVWQQQVRQGPCVAALNDLECEMKTYPLLAKDGVRPFAFEVENIYLSPGTIAHLVAEVAGVTDVVQRKMFSKSSDVHVEFKYHGQPYMVWEPYGDSSRYWIGPKGEANGASDIGALETVFMRYRPPLHRLLIGDVLTLRFITRLFGEKP